MIGQRGVYGFLNARVIITEMPASTVDPISAALRTALTKNESTENSLDAQLAGSTKKALLSNIEFEAAGSYQSTILDKLKSKYIVLKSAETPQPR